MILVHDVTFSPRGEEYFLSKRSWRAKGAKAQKCGKKWLKMLFSHEFACAISFCRRLPSLAVRPLERSSEHSTSENLRPIYRISHPAIEADSEHFTVCNRCSRGFRTWRKLETGPRHDSLARANGHRMAEVMIGEIVLHRVWSTIMCTYVLFIDITST